MFDFGDELVIGIDRIPLLIWIQLLVIFLLLILLYCFSISASGLIDLSPNADAPPSTSALLRTHNQPSKHPAPPAAAAAASSSRLHTTKVGESHGTKCNAGTSTSTNRSRRMRREDIQVREGCSSSKDATHASVLEGSYHPCHYFGLAKQAFLKCLGMDPTSKDSSNTTHRREQ